MFRTLMWITLLGVCMLSSAHAQSAIIKIVEFDKNTGIIDRGEQDGIRVGDVFEVNRYAEDFVFWVGRVEVIVVKPKAAGVKVLERAANASFLKGDVLEIRKREYDPMLDKLNHPASTAVVQDTGKQKVEEPIKPSVAMPPEKRALQFGLSAGLSVPMTHASESFGQNLSLQIVDNDGDVVDVVDMTHSYITSLAMQGYCTLPLSERMSVNLNLAYIPLNIKGDVESSLLDVGLMGSASVLKITSSLNYRWNDRWRVGAGIGVFMPKLTVNGAGNSLTVSDRHFGFAADLSHFLPLGSHILLRSVLEYSVFMDDGPAIHSLNFQTGPSFTIGR